MLIELPRGKTTITESSADRETVKDMDLCDVLDAHPHLQPLLEELQYFRAAEQECAEAGYI